MTESSPTQALNRKVVIVVDNKRVIANTLAIILTKAGYDAHAFFSGQEAMAPPPY